MADPLDRTRGPLDRTGATRPMMVAMVAFEAVADEYDAARPAYPSGVFDALSPLEGMETLDLGAGTGIATRQLIARGARVTAVEPGRNVLGRAVAHTPSLRGVVADGAVLPVRTGAVDLVCCAQSWHWLRAGDRVIEAHRVLRDGGRWAAWWSHPRADDHDWFDRYWSAIERSCPGTHRGQRDTDWGATVADSGLFEVPEAIAVPWIREVTVDDWMTDQASHSYVAALPGDARRSLLHELRSIVVDHFGGSTMSVAYETRLWLAGRA